MADELTANVLAVQDGPTQEETAEESTAAGVTAGTDEPQANANEGDEEAEEHKGKRLGGWQRKIKKLEEQNELLMEMLKSGGAKGAEADKKQETKPADDAPKRPNINDFRTIDEYEAAMDKYHDDRTEYKIKKALESHSAQQGQKSEQQKVQSSWDSKVSEFKKEHPDFEEVAYDQSVPVTDVMRDAIVTSDIGTEVAYFLGKHPEEAERIAALPPVRQAAAIGKIEAQLAKVEEEAEETEKANKPPAAKAPKPPTPVKKPSPTAPVDLNDPNLPTDQWFRERNKQIYGK